jgi:hypothetical protein
MYLDRDSRPSMILAFGPIDAIFSPATSLRFLPAIDGVDPVGWERTPASTRKRVRRVVKVAG